MMEVELFRRFCGIAYERAGIDIRDGKESLVSARVAKRLRALGIASVREYLSYLESDSSGEEMVLFLDAISTNHTSFFREPEHFELLAQVVKGSLSQGAYRFRIWSAASSSGEEPYTIAMTVQEALGGQALDWKLLATDISTRVLTKAQDGIYSGQSLESVPAPLRAKYFSRLRGDAARAQDYQVSPQLRQSVVFKRLNLSKPPFPMKGPLDMVFCRNVMMYFDNRVRQGLLKEIERLLRPGGFLVIGHAETLTGIETGLTRIRPSVFSKS